jgi:hypothetical protein
VWWAENQGTLERSRVTGSYACGGGWMGRSRGGKPGLQGGRLRLLSARRGQSWWPEKGSVHGPKWLRR